MSVKLALKIESDVAANRPVTIPFDFSHRESLPKGKRLSDSIVITPITVRTWFRIKPLLLQIEKEDLENLSAHKESVLDRVVAGLMAKYDELIFEIICLGIHNKRGDMPAWFREVLKDNCTWEDLYVLYNAITFRLNSNSFFNTITALGVVSPLGEEEIIALQRNKESWSRNRKAVSCS